MFVPAPALVSLAALGAALPAIVASYLLGSVPFGLVFVRLVKGIDIRTVGSGNIGATNAARAGGRTLGVLVFLCDLLKGWVAPAIFATRLAPWTIGEPGDLTAVACGAAAVLGHCFPIYLRFKGGKGVATGCGALIALDPQTFVWGAAVWIATVALTRYAGLASILMGCTFPVAAWLLFGPSRPELTLGALLLTVLILVRHRSNIARMLAGTEPRMFAGKVSDGGERT
jgi:acyl phosphate:glycerol-3-phosphate acyltransferase